MFKKSSALMWYGVLIFTAAILALALPPNPETLHTLDITPLEYKAAVFTLIVPYALIWFSAFYAYDKLEKYVDSVRDTREGEAFKKIADGVRILAWGLAIPTIINTLLMALEAAHPGFHAAQAIINNYIALLVPLIAYTFIGNGTRLLTETVRARPSQIGTRLLVGTFIIVSVFFTYFVVRNQAGNNVAYHLPTFLLLVTFVGPYLYAWLIGLLAAYELRLYSLKTKGVLYQRALVWLAAGITIVVIGSIMVQYLNGIFAGKGDIKLGSILVAVYGLLVVQGAGFVLVALGAKRLKMIEEV